MKYIILLVLPSCSLFDAALFDAVAPVVAEVAVEIPKLAAQVATGQWGAAVWTAIGIGGSIVSALGYKGGKAVVKKVRASEPGKLV